MGKKPRNRADLIELGALLRRRLDTLYTLGNVNDPWMADVGYRSKAAHWVAGIFERFEIRSRVHVRRVFYRLVSQETPVLLPDGTPFINHVDHFNKLCDAVRDARYLALISTEVIIDRRNPAPTINSDDGLDTAAEVEVSDGSVERHEFGPSYSPPTIELPEASLQEEPSIGQRYHLEIWIEKSTANDVLLPLGREYGINVATFIGEVSATACKDLVDRAIASGKPVRIFHVTDFDPAGRDMPISAAVKIDYFAAQSGVDLDIRLEHVALTEEQCIEYRLPRTPIKQTEGRGAGFEARYGAGATELDALEALHPGVLREILVEHIERYYDSDLNDEVETAVDQFTDELSDAGDKIEEQFAEETEDIDDQRERIAAAFEEVNGPAKEAYDRAVEEAQRVYEAALGQARAEIEEMEDRLAAQAEAMLTRMKAALEGEIPDPDWPEPADADEDDDVLYDSTRDYVEQIDVYRAHRGDDEDVGLAADRLLTKTCALCGKSFTTAAKKRVFCSLRCTNKSSKNKVRARRDSGSSQAE